MEYADLLNAGVYFINKGLLNAFKIGSIYALGAVGITLVFGILRFAHFAHGDMMTFGALIAFAGTVILRNLGINTEPIPTGLLALPLAVAATIILALIIDRHVYAHFRASKSPPVVFVMTSIGVTFILQGIIRLVGGTGDRQFFFTAVSNGESIREDKGRWLVKFDWLRDHFDGFTQKLVITMPQLWLFIFTAVALVGLHYFLNHTRTGKAMRAVSDNEDLARISGIDVGRVVKVTWVIAGTLAAIAGTLLAMDTQYKPILAFNLLLPMFAAAIMGGIGKPFGAVAGAFIVALAETFAVFDWRPIAGYLFADRFDMTASMALVPAEYKLAVPFAILVLVLIWRPTGIFKGQVL
ncbi:MAG: branched-chain amino acid ABC transporter permease [marine bacterium B5-7]|nr:MAG: branched-chain amino acid ABC transporter permease [marine bacterium B5-7]